MGIVEKIALVGLAITAIGLLVIPRIKHRTKGEEPEYYNTVQFKCRKCNKYLSTHGIFIVSKKEEYCQCDDPEYYSTVESVKREL